MTRYHGIPARLRERDQWLVTRDKEPIRPRTDWNQPKEQLTVQDALYTAGRHVGEPAFVIRPDDPFVLIDFDDVGSPANLPDTVQTWIDDLGTYTEVSRSGTGLHLICEGTRLPNRQSKGELESNGSIEVYDASRYVVLTGDRIGPKSDVRSGGDELLELQREYLPERTGQKDQRWVRTRSPDELDLGARSARTLSLTAEDIWRTIREYAAGGSDEAKDTSRLWNSRAGTSVGYQSASEADLGLSADLAFWCREDARLMDKCFRRSSRYRNKWDEVHYKDGRTYGEGTIQTAINSNYGTYSVDRYVVWE